VVDRWILFGFRNSAKTFFGKSLPSHLVQNRAPDRSGPEVASLVAPLANMRPGRSISLDEPPRGPNGVACKVTEAFVERDAAVWAPGRGESSVRDFSPPGGRGGLRARC
jgi:hypothetical protein